MADFKTTPPKTHILQNKGDWHYSDCFAHIFKDPNNRISITDIARAFFSSAPTWVGILFSIRNRIVSLFGLKTSGNATNQEEILKNCNFQPGDQLGLFKIFARSEDEIIFGEDDKHLNFRVSLLIQNVLDVPKEKKLSISTTVKFNNWLGRLYFLPVKPFHQLIVSVMTKRIVQKLEKS
jgi:hypothetical protein